MGWFSMFSAIYYSSLLHWPGDTIRLADTTICRRYGVFAMFVLCQRFIPFLHSVLTVIFLQGMAFVHKEHGNSVVILRR